MHGLNELIKWSRARHFGWPNTYVFTKAMGEMMVGKLRGDIPVVIVRPSIITSVQKDPLPGWIEGTRSFSPSVHTNSFHPRDQSKIYAKFFRMKSCK